MQKSIPPILMLASVLVAGCAHTPGVKPTEGPQDAAAQQGAMTETEAAASLRYEAGLRALGRGMYQDAIKDFETLRTEFPYSRFAALGELRIADAHIKRAQYLEAIDAYRAFLRFHPSHPEAAYALGKVGEAYYAQIPKDFFLLPPSREKDLGHVKEAITAYQELLARFPAVSDSEAVNKQLIACRKKLADHEMYVARFYFDRKQWPGAVLRLGGLLKEYAGVGYDAEALYLMAVAHDQLGQLDQALASVTQLLADYPDTQAGHKGSRLLEQLEGKMR